jgi:hypothetical protein
MLENDDDNKIRNTENAIMKHYSSLRTYTLIGIAFGIV